MTDPERLTDRDSSEDFMADPSEVVWVDKLPRPYSHGSMFRDRDYAFLLGGRWVFFRNLEDAVAAAYATWWPRLFGSSNSPVQIFQATHEHNFGRGYSRKALTFSILNNGQVEFSSQAAVEDHLRLFIEKTRNTLSDRVTFSFPGAAA